VETRVAPAADNERQLLESFSYCATTGPSDALVGGNTCTGDQRVGNGPTHSHMPSIHSIHSTLMIPNNTNMDMLITLLKMPIKKFLLRMDPTTVKLSIIKTLTKIG